MTARLDYRWHLRKVMADRGMFATTDLIEPLAAARDPAVFQPGLPAGRRAAGAAEPEDPHGAAGHPGLLDGRPDRAGRAAGQASCPEEGRPARRPASATCVPSGPASMAPGSRDQPRVLRAGRIRPDRADHRPGRGGRTPAGAGQIRTVVTAVTGGRAKSRRLAAALAERPEVLADGRSPAPRAVGDLLLALRRAGAQALSPPCCAQCGKQLRTFQRRGQDWYCSVCGQHTGACAACGNTRRSPPGTGPGGHGAHSARTPTTATPSP